MLGARIARQKLLFRVQAYGSLQKIDQLIYIIESYTRGNWWPPHLSYIARPKLVMIRDKHQVEDHIYRAHGKIMVPKLPKCVVEGSIT